MRPIGTPPTAAIQTASMVGAIIGIGKTAEKPLFQFLAVNATKVLPILPKKRLKCKNLLHFVEFLDIIYIIFYMRHFLFDICKLPRSV